MEEYKVIEEVEALSIEAAVQPKVLNIMMRLQCEFNLPIQIEVDGSMDELVKIKLSTSVDEEVLNWFLNSADIIFQLNESWKEGR